MPDVFLRNLTSPEGRTLPFYLTVFAVPGATSAYLGIWLFDKGLSAGEIGWINSVPLFLTLVLNVYVGRLADRARDWRSVIIAGALVSALLPAGLFFANDFWSILAVLAMVLVPFSVVMPIIDAAVLRMTRRRGSNFAFLRAFGTMGYMLTLVVTAWTVENLGGQMFVPLLLGITLTRAVLALILPKFRAAPEEMADQPQPPPPSAAQPVVSSPPAGRLSEVMKPWFLAPIFAFALVQSLHYILAGFGGVVWTGDGISEGWIGPLLAVGAISEVAAMFMFKRFARRFSARHLILFAMLVSALRWGVMSFDLPLWLLALSQTAHGITFGVAYLGLINFIANWTAEDTAAEAQSFANVVQLGVIVVVMSGFGYLIDLYGRVAFAAGIGMSLIAALLVFWSLRAMPTSETSSAAT